VFKEVDEKELCNKVNYSNTLHTTLSSYITALKKSETKVLALSAFEIIMVFNRLSFYHFCKVMQEIDNNYPGISFHIIMEARLQQEDVVHKTPNLTRYQNIVYLSKDNKEPIDRDILPYKEAQAFLHRLHFLNDINCLNQIFASSRSRILRGLLDQDNKNDSVITQEKIALHNYFKWVNKDQSISYEFKKQTEDLMNMFLARHIIENYQPIKPAAWSEDQFIKFLKDSVVFDSVQAEI
jgi:hypothetical protein